MNNAAGLVTAAAVAAAAAAATAHTAAVCSRCSVSYVYNTLATAHDRGHIIMIVLISRSD